MKEERSRRSGLRHMALSEMAPAVLACATLAVSRCPAARHRMLRNSRTRKRRAARRRGPHPPSAINESVLFLLSPSMSVVNPFLEYESIQRAVCKPFFRSSDMRLSLFAIALISCLSRAAWLWGGGGTGCAAGGRGFAQRLARRAGRDADRRRRRRGRELRPEGTRRGRPQGRGEAKDLPGQRREARLDGQALQSDAKGRTFFLCCDGCLAELDAHLDKYLKKLKD